MFHLSSYLSCVTYLSYCRIICPVYRSAWVTSVVLSVLYVLSIVLPYYLSSLSSCMFHLLSYLSCVTYLSYCRMICPVYRSAWVTSVVLSVLYVLSIVLPYYLSSLSSCMFHLLSYLSCVTYLSYCRIICPVYRPVCYICRPICPVCPIYRTAVLSVLSIVLYVTSVVLSVLYDLSILLP